MPAFLDFSTSVIVIAMKYDVFISYRRTSYESANLIATRLRAEGYRVFFDLESMRSGLFNEQLYNVIEECKDFVLVLPPDALDRCHDEEDWLRKEILHAMKHKKNIIPVTLNGFQWPDSMPSGMENLCMYQSLSASSVEYFDLSMKRLEKYLKSRRYSKGRVFARWTAGIVGGLVAIFFVSNLLLRLASVSTCTALVDHLTMQMGVADLIMDSNAQIQEAWEDLDGPVDEDFMDLLDFHEDEINRMQSVQSPKKLEFTGFQMLMLGAYGLSEEAISQFDESVDLMYEEIRRIIDYIRSNSDMDLTKPSMKHNITNDFKVSQHMNNATYYVYLQVMNVMPAKSLDNYHKVASKFSYMPKCGIGLKSKEYEKMATNEFAVIEKLIGEIGQNVRNTEDELVEQEARLDSLDREILKGYNEDLATYAISPDDVEVLNWNRILMITSYLEGTVEMAADEDIYDMGPVTPEIVFADLSRMIDEFVTLYPYAGNYALPVKEFYREVAAMKRPFKGVLFGGFSDGNGDDGLKLGDIIIKVNGDYVSSTEEITEACKRIGDVKMTYLRLVDGELKENSVELPSGVKSIMTAAIKL